MHYLQVTLKPVIDEVSVFMVLLLNCLLVTHHSYFWSYQTPLTFGIKPQRATRLAHVSRRDVMLSADLHG